MNALSLFNSLFDEMDSNVMPSAARFERAISMPRVDVTEKKDDYELAMELPGLNENDVQIELKDKVLSIASHKEESKKEDKKDGTYLIKERRSFDFERRFTLPEDIDEEAVTADFANGILTVKIPRKALAAPKRICISAKNAVNK